MDLARDVARRAVLAHAARDLARSGRRRAPRPRRARRTAASSSPRPPAARRRRARRRSAAARARRGRSPRCPCGPAAVDRRVRAPVDDRRAARRDARSSRRGARRPGTSRSSSRAGARRRGRSRSAIGIDGIGSVITSSPTSPMSSLPVLVVGGDRGAQRARLELALVHGQRRDAADERRADVRAAARREEPDVLTELVGDPAEALRATAASRSSRRCAACLRSRPSRGLHAGLHARGDVARARPEARHPRVLREVPQPPEVGVAGIAVVEDDRGLGQQHADEEVPHHPAGRREPEDAIAPGARRGAGAAS